MTEIYSTAMCYMIAVADQRSQPTDIKELGYLKERQQWNEKNKRFTGGGNPVFKIFEIQLIPSLHITILQ